MARIPIRKRTKEEEEDKERFTSKDLTRKQVFLYIFEDFFKGFFIFGSLFLDGLVVLYVVRAPLVNEYYGLSVLFQILTLLLVFTMIPILVILVYLQRRYYMKLFGEEATKKRYRKKQEVE